MRHLNLLLTLFLIGGGMSCAIAQVTTGSLTGSVMDEKGEFLVGATVLATHKPTGTRYGTTTREDGRYDLPNLRVGGPYSVTATYIGFKSQDYEGIFLNLGQRLPLNFQLPSETTTLDDVLITADPNSPLNSERTGPETNITSTQIKSLPTISRSASDYYRLTPSSDGNSFGGRNDQFNNFHWMVPSLITLLGLMQLPLAAKQMPNPYHSMPLTRLMFLLLLMMSLKPVSPVQLSMLSQSLEPIGSRNGIWFFQKSRPNWFYRRWDKYCCTRPESGTDWVQHRRPHCQRQGIFLCQF